MNRRDVLTAMGLSSAAMLAGRAVATPAIMAGGIRVYDPRQFGAAGDGRTLDSPAINRAIDAATAAGGGTVYLSPGVYRSGTIVLKSNVTLYLDAGTTLLGSTDIADYTPQPGPNPKGDANDKHLVFARDAENVTLAGPGRIDGQGPSYWVKVNELPEDDWGAVATHRYTFRPRPSPLLEFYRCTNLRLVDLTIENAPGWTLRPMACHNVFIHGLTIRNPVHGINTDGIDPTCCTDVSISDCHITTGDDAICLKSEDMYGNDVGVSRNITITNCVLSCCCNGIKFGTSTYGGFENVSISNVVIANDDVPVPERVIAGLAIEMVDGGYLDGVTVSNVRMQRVRAPLFVHLGARHGPTTTRPAGDVTRGRSFLRNVTVQGLHATGAVMTSSVSACVGNTVEDVTLCDVHVQTEEFTRYPVQTAAATQGPPPEGPAFAYPEARMFGRLPAHGLYVRHARGVRLRGVTFDAPAAETRPAVVADDVEGLDVDGLRANATHNGGPMLRLTDVRRAFVRGAVAAPGTDAFVRVEGSRSERIVLTACDLMAAARSADEAGDVPPGAVRVAFNVERPD